MCLRSKIIVIVPGEVRVCKEYGTILESEKKERRKHEEARNGIFLARWAPLQDLSILSPSPHIKVEVRMVFKKHTHCNKRTKKDDETTRHLVTSSDFLAYPLYRRVRETNLFPLLIQLEPE